MSDTPKKGSGFPGAGEQEDDLLAEFDAWDKSFDAMFANEEEPTADSVRRAPQGRKAAPSMAREESSVSSSYDDPFGEAPAISMEDMEDDEFEKELDFLHKPEALGDLLGPMPLPPPEDASGQPGELDDVAEPFTVRRDEDTSESVFTSAPRPVRPSRVTPGEVAQATEEVTRVLDADDEVLAAALRATEPDPDRPAAKTAAPRRPTIVRREDLERRRRSQFVPAKSDPDDDSDFSFETTRIADARQLESLVESASLSDAGDEPEPPAITVEVDDEFYDDIVIGDENRGEEVKKAVPQPAAPKAAARRISPHLVRRDAIRPDTSQSAAKSAVEPAVRSQDALQTSAEDVLSDVASGRAVDPEITLDMRVVDADILTGLPEEFIEALDMPVASSAGTAEGAVRSAFGEESAAAGRAHTNVGWPPPELRRPDADDVAGGPEQPASDSQDSELVFDIMADEPAGPPSESGSEPEIEFDIAADASSTAPEPEAAAAPAGPEPAMALGAEPAAGESLELELGAEPAAGESLELGREHAEPPAEGGLALELGHEPDSAEALDGAPVAAPGPAAAPAATFDLAAELAADLDSIFPPDLPHVANLADLAGPGRGDDAELYIQPSGGKIRFAVEQGQEPLPDVTAVLGQPRTGGDAPEVTAVLGQSRAGADGPDAGDITKVRVRTRSDAARAEPRTIEVAPAPPAPAAPTRAQTRPPTDLMPLAPLTLHRSDMVLEGTALELPPPKLPRALPALRIHLSALPEQAEPHDAARASEILAQDLALYEREIEHAEDPAHATVLHFEAGRLAEKLGDQDGARAHYEWALESDPQLTPAMRAMRRIARAAGRWTEAIGFLDMELAEATEAEGRALRAHRVDMLMAAGEQDLARVAVGEILDQEPDDVRALLANLELAFVDGRTDEFSDALDRLAKVLTDPGLQASLHVLRGRLLERLPGAGDRAVAAYEQAAGAGSPSALVAMARVARKAGDARAAIQAMARLDQTGLADRDPAYAAALDWRRARWAGAIGDAESRTSALARAAGLSPSDPLILAERAEAAMAHESDEARARALLALAASTASPAERARACVRASACLGRLGRAKEAAHVLRHAVELDPSDPEAASALDSVLLADGGMDALIARDRQAAEADPMGAVFERVRAAERLARAGRHDEAIADLRAGLELAPDSPALLDALLEVLALAGKKDERVALIQRLAEETGEYADPEQAVVRAARATEARAMELDAALRELHARAAGEAPEAASMAVAIDELSGRRERAITTALDLWHRAIELDPEWAEAHASCIRLSRMLGNADVIEDALGRAQAASRDPWHAVTLALGRAALVMAGPQPDPTRAEDLAREAAGLVPEDPRPWQRLVLIAASQRGLSEAATVLEERAGMVQGDEATSLAFRAAAMLLHDHHVEEPERAALLLRRVADAKPRFQAGRDMLRATLRLLGEPVPVDMDMDMATGAEPGTEPGAGQRFERLFHDAELHHLHGGDAARAVKLYARALAQKPDHPLAREGLRRAAEAAGDTAVLADMALRDLAAAEAAGSGAAKAGACEELARIDGELRGDSDSALLALQSAAEADPGRAWVVRMLERAYTSQERWAELRSLRQRQIERTGEAMDRVALLVDRARLGHKLGGADTPDSAGSEEILSDYGRAHELDPVHRRALFHLESAARQHGASAERAVLEARIADYFKDNGRARAAFLTRSAETLTDIQELGAAMARFREASDCAGGYAPALFGWRHAALLGQTFGDVAEAALREAEQSAADEDQVALAHLAGVAFMDRARSPERAIEALERVMAADPAHDDAFARLRVLFATAGQNQKLAELLGRRLEVETEPMAKAGLHKALAELCRTLGDHDQAKHHLRAVLELAPGEPGAVSALSDLAWEQAAWDEAAEMLIARARMESDPGVLTGIFSRLGLIYSDKKPDPQWAVQSFKKVLSYDPQNIEALEHLSRLGMQIKDWKLALGACERLLKLDKDDDARVRHLHRIGEIHVQGFGDRAGAERAYRTALDTVPTSDAALSALVEFFEESHDRNSVRVHLDRVIGAMRVRLGQDIADPTAYRVIARALAARERAGVPGSLAAARCVAELAQLFGGDELGGELAATGDADRLAALARREVDDLLFPAEVSLGMRQLFGLLGERIPKHVGVDLRRYNVGRNDKVQRSGEPILTVAQDMAAAMGVDLPAIYISAREPTLLVAEPTSPISLIVGADLVKSGDTRELRFVLGRALKLSLSWFAVPARMSADEFGVLMVALLRQFEPEFAPVGASAEGIDAEAVSAQYQRLRRLIPSGMIQELRPFAVGVAGSDFDHRALWSGIDRAGNRAGLVAAGSAAAALTVLCTMRGHADVAAGAQDPVIADLLRFAVSEDHVSLRAMLAE